MEGKGGEGRGQGKERILLYAVGALLEKSGTFQIGEFELGA